MGQINCEYNATCVNFDAVGSYLNDSIKYYRSSLSFPEAFPVSKPENCVGTVNERSSINRIRLVAHIIYRLSISWRTTMNRKLVGVLVVSLLAVLAQVTFVVHAEMHFPVTAVVVNSLTFNGTASIYGYGSNTDFVVVTLKLGPSNLTALCENAGGKIAPGQTSVIPNLTASSGFVPSSNGNFFYQFAPINLVPSVQAAGCPNAGWTVAGLKGTLTGSYFGQEYDSTRTVVVADAFVPFTGTLSGGSGSTTCTQGKEVDHIYH